MLEVKASSDMELLRGAPSHLQFSLLCLTCIAKVKVKMKEPGVQVSWMPMDSAQFPSIPASACLTAVSIGVNGSQLALCPDNCPQTLGVSSTFLPPIPAA